MRAPANGKVHASEWKAWREQALACLNLPDIYGEYLTGRQQGPGWLECRDPRSPTGDRNPSAGVADGTGQAERGAFKSFRPGNTDKAISVFDFMVETGRAEDLKAAQRMIAELTGVPLPSKKPPAAKKTKPAGDGQSGGGNKEPATAYALNWIPSSDFASGNYRPSWLIEKVFVANEPGFCGGPNKSLKTSIMLDCGISLGSATAFLGKYRVPRVVPTGILSGESGRFALQQTALRICEARGISLANVNVFWEFCLPQLANLAHLAVLAKSLKEQGIEVLLLDPLYLCLLSGNEAKGLQAGNLFDIGPLLLNVTKTCLDVGCTPFLIHHTKKNLADPFQPLELSDMAFSGCAEFARQWMLINRREKYEHGSGRHKLWVSVGGSEGQSQLLAVDVDEGVLEDDFSGRTWCVSCVDPNTAREQAAQKNEEAKELKKQKQAHNDGSKLLAAMRVLDQKGEGLTKRKLRDNTGLSDRRVQTALEALVEEGAVELFKGEVEIGSGSKRKNVDLYRHAKHSKQDLHESSGNLAGKATG